MKAVAEDRNSCTEGRARVRDRGRGFGSQSKASRWELRFDTPRPFDPPPAKNAALSESQDETPAAKLLCCMEYISASAVDAGTPIFQKAVSEQRSVFLRGVTTVSADTTTPHARAGRRPNKPIVILPTGVPTAFSPPLYDHQPSGPKKKTKTKKMYLRAAHAERHLPTLRAFIRSNPLGILTTAIDSPAHPFLQSSHIPFLLDVLDDASETELGTLRGHMARANPQAKALMEHLKALQTQDGPQVLARDVMVLFNGPAHHYVTPRFYVETKPATGKVVPTWNYSAVQVYGRLTVYFDGKHPSTSDYLQKQVGELSQYAETRIMEYEKAWKVEDAPTAYVDALKKAIIGIEIEITDMGGKWKMSQEMGVGDRQGVVDGFDALGTEEGKKIAETVKEKGKWD